MATKLSPELEAYMAEHDKRKAEYRSRSLAVMLDTIGQRMAVLFVRGDYEDLHRVTVDFEIFVQGLASGQGLPEITARFVRGSADVAGWRNIYAAQLKKVRPASGTKG
jgi:hypothetical protein